MLIRVPSERVAVDRSLHCTSMPRTFVFSRLYAISGGWLKIVRSCRIIQLDIIICRTRIVEET